LNTQAHSEQPQPRKRSCFRSIPQFCEQAAGRWTFKAVIYKSQTCKGFIGYGDADPSNVSPLVHGAEMRMAETRAVNRALRKAYGIGICSVESGHRMDQTYYRERTNILHAGCNR
jgi:hypothetical protein